VIGTWAALAAALVWCIAAFTVNVPLAEDWHMVPPLTGHTEHLWSWLWEQNNEHRLPLPRLLLLGTLAATGDFRAGMVVNVAVMAAAAMAVLWALRHARGGALRYSDAFIPIVLLHIGNWENFMWAWQLCFVLSAALCLVLLAALAGPRLDISPARAGVAAAAVAALPLCGANGIAFAAPMAAWLGIEAVLLLRAGGAAARAGLILFAGLIVAAASTAYYFVDYTSATWNPASPGLIESIETALKFQGLAFGPAVAPRAGIAGLVAAILVGAATMTLVPRLRGGGRGRIEAARMLAFAAGAATLAIAFGWGRAGLVPTVGFPDRYVLLAAPGIVWAYVVIELHGGPRLRQIVPPALLVAACAMLPLNTRDGFYWRDWYRDGMARVIADVNSGASADTIVTRHGQFLMHWAPDRLRAGLEMLRDTGVGPITALRREAAPSSAAGAGAPLPDKAGAASTRPAAP
jgi:hypothetical protein